MDGIKIFESEQFGKIRTAGTSEEPLFCAIDVCRALQYTNNRRAIALHVDNEDVTKCYAPTNGGEQELAFVTESGLYSLIFGCKLPNAKIFKRYVTSEILPSIRKTGRYETSGQHGAFQVPQTFYEALMLAAQQQKQIEEQQQQLTEQEPKVNFANAMLTSSTSCLVGELAKVITQNGFEIGQNRLFKWLRDNGYLGKWGERKNIPLQQYVEQGLFQLKKSTWQDSNNVTHTSTTVKVTGKGQQYFINKFLNNKNKQS